ncbi:MAG TPA: pimeloyl-[acyl-carrier protein] methyl ester esterase [Thiolapillus brandeum]|uniref:Pimeloyl-[acyl-carrier protein] methyl ester esterase n=1 Tax=Thiolapillus brandeum TaxID=1076588 RepID=A0A7C5MU70_9GAMM|nr:pimeloyl-[acyl-carrier protein] methyl ester esterase [Thiolapillus brandeum]
MSRVVEVSGSGPDLVLLHGWGMNGAAWDPLLPLLESRFRVTRLELPGHGESPWDDEGGDLARWAEAALAAAPPQAAWLGWSLGGLVMQRAAVLAPERVSALVGVATTPCFVRREGWETAMTPESLAQFGEALETDLEGTIRRFLALQFHGVEDGRALQRELGTALAQRPRPVPEALRAGLSLLLESDLREPLAGIDRPRLWILGGRDRLVPPGLGSALPPGVQVRLLERAGHAPFLSHPEAVAVAMTEFLGHG